MATHSSVLAWRIPGMEEPGGLPSMWSHRVGYNLSDLAAAAAAPTSAPQAIHGASVKSVWPAFMCSLIVCFSLLLLLPRNRTS